MATDNIPTVSATLRLEPCIYSLSSEPPTLHLEVTSYHNGPVTTLIDNLSPRWMLRNGTALIVTDLVNDCTVEQTKRRPCRIPPPSKTSVPLIESQLCTLYPKQPLLISAPFFIRFRQQSALLHATDPIQAVGIEMDERSGNVHPLVPGHKYKVSLSKDEHLRWDSIRWWRYGTKEEVLKRELDGRAVRYGNSPNGVIAVDTSRVAPIVFTCTE
ncbi:hypothetical protein F5B22DRAFT_619495 [Xylaria bambusicola]|uniref:uncharacterized protein n=1 Tax=Xylaria bambusicola TaxID=326684 RepID=UPI00200832AF|nr:uncharacterized protein F5B22DRAFT_619495 [Xylaria bambusicola]KAI0508762.1 hypothetical protein F5B22DRAFT_619495 [Xylaria bambusicola]